MSKTVSAPLHMPCAICGCTGERHELWCLNGKQQMVDTPHPTAEAIAVAVGKATAQHYGWLCSRCGTSNAPHQNTCGNPACNSMWQGHQWLP